VSEIVAHTSLRSPGLILESDGVQILGTPVLDAFDRLEVLESTAEAMIDGPALSAGVIHHMVDDVIAGLGSR
jgi:L-fuculose-phosphate aldolase